MFSFNLRIFTSKLEGRSSGCSSPKSLCLFFYWSKRSGCSCFLINPSAREGSEAGLSCGFSIQKLGTIVILSQEWSEASWSRKKKRETEDSTRGYTAVTVGQWPKRRCSRTRSGMLWNRQVGAWISSSWSWCSTDRRKEQLPLARPPPVAASHFWVEILNKGHASSCSEAPGNLVAIPKCLIGLKVKNGASLAQEK